MNLLKPYQQKIADDFSKIYTVMDKFWHLLKNK